ncbi:MAG: hypothetical protein QOI66_835 [Myxococcales bacterium]|nr:hypothetical protein [Myxococcales bacterium]
MKRRLVGAIVASSLLCVACSTYSSITPALAPSSGTVRLSLNDAGRTETLAPFGKQVTSVEGKVRSVTDSAITIAVSEVSRASSDVEQYHGEAMTIPSRYVGVIERKHVQVARSLAIAGAILAGAIWIGTQGHGDVTYRTPGGPPTNGGK